MIGDPYPLATFRKRLRGLTATEAESVERRVDSVGLAASADWDEARLIIDRAAATADRAQDRVAGGTAVAESFAQSPAGRRGYQLAAVAAEMAGQALGVRQLLDRATWDVVRSPWIGVLSLPDWGESGVGSAAEVGEQARAEIVAQRTAPAGPQADVPTPGADAPVSRARTWAAPFGRPARGTRGYSAPHGLPGISRSPPSPCSLSQGLLPVYWPAVFL